MDRNAIMNGMAGSGSAGYNWSGVIDFLITQCRQGSIKEGEWELEKKDLKEKIAALEANAKVQEGLNGDLIRRVKMLEVCLKKERMKFMAYLAKKSKEERDEILHELKKSEAVPYKIEAEINQLRPDLELPKRRAKRQRQFLERVLKEFDCTDILDELVKNDENFDDKRNSNADLENELLASPLYHNSKDSSKPIVGGGHQERATGERTVHREIEPSPMEVIFKQGLHSDSLRCLTVLDEGRKLVTAGEDGRICLINLDNLVSGKENPLLDVSTEDTFGLHSVSGRNNILFSGGTEGKIRLWDVGKTLTYCESFEFHKDCINNLRVHPKENILLSTSFDGRVRSIKFKSNNFVDKNSAPNFILGNGKTPASLAWSGEAKMQFAVGILEEAEINFFDLKNPKPVSHLKIEAQGYLTQLQGLADESTYLAACEDAKIYLIDPLSNKVVQKYESHVDSVASISLSSDSNHFLSGSSDGMVKLWDRRKGKVIAEIQAHKRNQQDAVNSVCFLKEAKIAFSGGADGELIAYTLNDLY